MILDCRYLHDETGISENDIAKRLMDYGYHAPTLSFPVHGTLMIEPTESESLWELDNFVTVMQTIWQEIQEVKNGSADKEDNVLVNAPHPEYEVVPMNGITATAERKPLILSNRYVITNSGSM